MKLDNPQPIFHELVEISSKYGVVTQMCAASRVVTWEHLFFGCLFAMLAFKQERNLLNRLPLEILLYVSGQRQIKIALEDFGMKDGDNCIIILGNSEASMKQALTDCEKLIGGEHTDEVLNISKKSKRVEICRYFQINSEELNAIAQSDAEKEQAAALFKAILNRMALIALEK